jgi:NitT/TauT family transport system permease protein
VTSRARGLGLALLGVLVLVLLWEGYKAIDGRILGWQAPARADDTAMPHVWTMVERLFDPESRASDRPIWLVVVDASWYSLRLAAVGLVAGGLVGVGLAVVMLRFRTMERALLPYVVISQTIPLVALAPLVVAWGGRLTLFGYDWERWMSVALIAGYLAFAPIAVGALRGLQSPPPASVELMESLAASWRETLWKVRFPAAVPHLIPAIRLAAAAAIVGTIVAEISTGTKGGIGRLILEYSRAASSDPAKVYTAMMGAAVLGVLVAGIVMALDAFLMRNRPREVAS